MYSIPKFRNISCILIRGVNTLNCTHRSVRGHSSKVQRLQTHLGAFIHGGHASSDFSNIQFQSTNGMDPFSFENAENRIVESGYSCEFSDIFSMGLETVFKFCGAGMDMLNEWEKDAIKRLLDFFDDIDFHQKKIQDILYTHHLLDIPYKEEDITLCYAEHLIKHLVPGGKYLVSQATRKTRDGCCSCGTPGSYGFTGFGHQTVWHGHPDMIVKGDDWGNTVLTVNASKAKQEQPTKFIVEGTVWEDTYTPDSHSLFPFEISMAEMDIAKEANQSLSQTITYSFLQRYVTKNHKSLTPGIMLNCKRFEVYLYDCIQDILLVNVETPHLLQISYDKDDRPVVSDLNIMAVIYLWFILNHGKFCSGLSPMAVTKLVTSGFHKLLGKRLNIYKQLLTDNVAHFPDRSKNFRSCMTLSHREAKRRKKDDTPSDPDSK